jgi:hypothetical protein
MGETSKKRVRANTEPDPETMRHSPDEQKGRSSSRLEASKGPAEGEEKSRVVEKRESGDRTLSISPD